MPLFFWPHAASERPAGLWDALPCAAHRSRRGRRGQPVPPLLEETKPCTPCSLRPPHTPRGPSARCSRRKCFFQGRLLVPNQNLGSLHGINFSHELNCRDLRHERPRLRFCLGRLVPGDLRKPLKAFMPESVEKPEPMIIYNLYGYCGHQIHEYTWAV